MGENRTWREKADSQYKRITGAQSRRELQERERAYTESLQRCNCKEPVIARMYLGVRVCAYCNRPRYS